ncbi:hypothetical protein [Vreelandella stevensii]|uniref:hypothetical protein n=1 Tax=Vreelandella stevensii TaxID=502821 RepID=UPI00374962EA
MMTLTDVQKQALAQELADTLERFRERHGLEEHYVATLEQPTPSHLVIRLAPAEE